MNEVIDDDFSELNKKISGLLEEYEKNDKEVYNTCFVKELSFPEDVIDKMNYENMIKIDIDDSLICLAGFHYGKYIYETQIETQISKKGLNSVVFPKKIEKFSTSFIEGLISVESEKGNKKFLLDRFKFKAGNRDVTDRFLEHIK